MNVSGTGAMAQMQQQMQTQKMDSGAYLDALMAVINGDFSSTSTSSSEFVTEVYA